MAEDKETYNDNQIKSRSLGWIDLRLVEQLRISLVNEVCIDDIVQNENESTEIELSKSGNSTTTYGSLGYI